MARQAHAVPDLTRLTLKLNADDPLDCLTAIRAARPDAQLVIDANGSWTPELMMAIGDGLARFEVALLEQPLPSELFTYKYDSSNDKAIPLGRVISLLISVNSPDAL